jgi:hypothetical protein
MKRTFAFVSILITIGGAASAQQTAAPAITVQSLLAQDYVVVGTNIVASAGGVLFLQKKDKLYLCVASETPTSPTVATRYCKPVE